MSKMTYIEIAGREYPMHFSIAAAKEITERFGDLEKMADAFSSGITGDTLQNILWMIELLIKQGCAYKNLFDQDKLVPENAVVVNKKWKTFETDMLGIELDLISVR